MSSVAGFPGPPCVTMGRTFTAIKAFASRLGLRQGGRDEYVFQKDIRTHCILRVPCDGSSKSDVLAHL